MRLLVTGGAGFMGSAFVRQAVARGYKVCVVDLLTYAGDTCRLEEVKERIAFYRTDIRDREGLEEVFRRERPQVLVHFAAESHVDRSILEPRAFLQTNVEGTLNLLELARRYPLQRIINVSTDEVYGELGEEGRFTEDSPLRPNSPYAVSKAAQDMLGRAYFRTYGLPVITVRPCNNYGPWQYPEKFIPVIIVRALRDEPVPLYGNGQNVREWLYVADCAEALLEVLEKGKEGETYNISSGIEKRNIEVARAVLDLLGKPHSLIKFVKDRPGHDFRYALDSRKIKKELGWKARTSFEEGLKQTVEWYQKNLEWVERKLRDLRKYWEKVYQGDP
ncbi:MAG: dTDP-glucose 4,6-dehydratase [Thermodesulfatator sp.]|nr:MAG: dTDP-glucose 4,6-dehydratase [Thermodesulfatator sp.]